MCFLTRTLRFMCRALNCSEKKHFWKSSDDYLLSEAFAVPMCKPFCFSVSQSQPIWPGLMGQTFRDKHPSNSAILCGFLQKSNVFCKHWGKKCKVHSFLGHSFSAAFGAHLRTPALKSENFRQKVGRFCKRENGFTKTLLSLFFQSFCPADSSSKSFFARFY